MKKLLSAVALIAAVAAEPALAQSADSASQQPDLTRNQALERADQLFDRFDLNHDGVVTRDEAERLGHKLMLQRAATGRDPAQGLGGHTLRVLKQRFSAAETVDRGQFEEAMLEHFDEMDVNHDGILTAAERLGAK
jgi:Ni/Co efflux regulator RcnB